jgi:hypothetical protein
VSVALWNNCATSWTWTQHGVLNVSCTRNERSRRCRTINNCSEVNHRRCVYSGLPPPFQRTRH